MRNRYSYPTPGVVSFKAYPEAMAGRSGTIYDGVLQLAKDDFFPGDGGRLDARLAGAGQGRETPPNDGDGYRVRDPTAVDHGRAEQQGPRGARTAGLGRGHQIRDRRGRPPRRVAIRLIASEDPGDERRPDAKSQIALSIDEICAYADERDIFVTLKVFHRDVAKESFIGTFEDTRDVAEDVAPRNDNFGLLVDLSHFPFFDIGMDEGITMVEDWVTDFHIGTSVLEEGHPSCGDQQPRFGIEHSENDTDDVAEFFEILLEKDLLNTRDRPMVGVAVAPQMAEDDAEVVVANAKRVWKRAWAMATE